MRHLPFLAISFVSILTACGSHSSNPTEGRGELDRMTFTYDGVFCLNDCSPGQPIAKGAHVVLAAKGDDGQARYRGRVTAPGLVIEHEDLQCMCMEHDANGSSSGGSIAPGESCYAPTVRECSRTFTLRADEAGPVTLEVLGPNDELVDRIALVVAKPERIEAVVKTSRPTGGTIRTVTPGPDGAFQVDAPARLDLEAAAFDGQGNALRMHTGDVAFASTDTKVSGWEGRYETEVHAPGVLHVTATGLGMTKPFVVRVIAGIPR